MGFCLSCLRLIVWPLKTKICFQSFWTILSCPAVSNIALLLFYSLLLELLLDMCRTSHSLLWLFNSPISHLAQYVLNPRRFPQIFLLPHWPVFSSAESNLIFFYFSDYFCQVLFDSLSNRIFFFQIEASNCFSKCLIFSPF